eukprot:CAMPEP_0197445480 /NCGR_PEP_ID=MMETSP1175-20131217/10692_1 /TAXON_ID=1003142 /ORGANISM="Triceratium dubium, Strain CCMP147" /LENGTH=259 /DNA_ID=CAMNT_0042976443 /DNA_START=250 /DNA_END=1029 /DNA_ORIENTATION=+
MSSEGVDLPSQVDDTVWKKPQVATAYLNDVRGSIPLADVQMETMLRVIANYYQPIDTKEAMTWLDMGCGDGVLGRTLAKAFPGSKGIMMDFSETMLDAARSKLDDANERENIVVVLGDYSQNHWMDELPSKKFDVVVSGFSIHHQTDIKKREIYSQIYDMLNPCGIFINLEHVLSPDDTIERMFYDSLYDAMYAFHKGTKTRKEIEDADRADSAANILAPVEAQCEWLRDTGFQHVDCYLKHFEIALFGGVKGRQETNV